MLVISFKNMDIRKILHYIIVIYFFGSTVCFSGHPSMWPIAVIQLVVRSDVDADFVVERAKHSYMQ